MADTEDHDLVDGDGYPTECGIGLVREFYGSPRQLVELLERLWWTPTLMTVEEWVDANYRSVVRVALVTGGWSGNEEIVDALHGSMFQLRFWQSSNRGGLHVYEVPKGEWEKVSQLGVPLAEGAGG